MSKTVSKFAFTVGIMLAMAFTFSCDSGGGGGGGYTRCSGGGSGSTCTNFKTKKIGEQTWMAENLNCDVGVSKCYADDPACCAKYGRLYDWSTALTACPSGWHLPSNAEWRALETAVGDYDTAGTKLKATSGWAVNGNGTDDYGFSALPGGRGSDGSFSGVEVYGHWWSANEYDSDDANFQWMTFNLSFLLGGFANKSDLYSVRCVQD
jgi:uncharacterized protein (TIGR02145 family)